MTFQTPYRRLARPAVLKSLHPHTPTTSIPLLHRRTLFGNLFKRSKKDSDTPEAPNAPSNPILDEYLKRKPSLKADAAQKLGKRGGLGSESIFESERVEQERDDAKKEKTEKGTSTRPLRDPTTMAAALDPQPGVRKRWERKMVIRQIRKRDRLTRAQVIKRTERESLAKSPFLKTSVKKLTKLANQIAGKPIEDAIVQMRFSKKKAAQDILKHLEQARDEAIVKRGMGLGEVNGTKGEPMEVESKDGKRRKIGALTGIYVDQAWVGRGKYEIGRDYRARGRVNLLRMPYTSISVLLKEEATQVRLAKERQLKLERKPVWVALPNKPVSNQHQYNLW